MTRRPWISLALMVVAASGCGGSTRTFTASHLPVAIDLSTQVAAPETYEFEDLAHLRIFLTESEIARYSLLSPEDRRETFRTVWASLDPTPTTERNERKEEHYRRLAYARRYFAREGSPPWDKRGELMIRYGSPRARVTFPSTIEYGLVIPPREIWEYTWPEMAFELADLLVKGDFQDTFQFMESSRPDAGHGGPIELGSTISLEPEEPLVTAEAQAAREERLLGQGFTALHEQAQAYLHDFGGRKLDFIFDVTDFATANRSETEVNVGFLFRAKDLAFEDRTARLDVDAVVKTMDYEEVARASHIMRQSRPASSKGFVADQVSLEVPPGNYRIALQVRDLASGNVGVFTTESIVREFTKSRLEISDLKLASKVEAGRTGHRFSKGDILVVPHPGGLYPRGVLVSLYFEVYGLTIPASGPAEFTITFTVAARNPKPGDDLPSVAISSDGTSRTRDMQKYFSFSTAEMDPGLYDVEVRIEDRVANASASQNAVLRVVES